MKFLLFFKYPNLIFNRICLISFLSIITTKWATFLNHFIDFVSGGEDIFIQRVHDSVSHSRKVLVAISILKNYFNTRINRFDFTIEYTVIQIFSLPICVIKYTRYNHFFYIKLFCRLHQLHNLGFKFFYITFD